MLLKTLLSTLIGVFLITFHLFSQEDIIQWKNTLELPSAAMSGAFVGLQGDKIIVAGGMFLQENEWSDGCDTIWNNKIFVRDISNTQHSAWQLQTARLPSFLSHGFSISTKKGLILLGGLHPEGWSKQVYLLQWQKKEQNVLIEKLPTLPNAHQLVTAALIDDEIYAINAWKDTETGRLQNVFFALNLAQEKHPEKLSWKKKPLWKGVPRTEAIGVNQSNGLDNCLYLFGGKGEQGQMLQDVYVYNPKSETWKQLRDYTLSKKHPISSLGTAGIAVGAGHILLLGGTKAEIPTNELLAYHTLTDAWQLVRESSALPVPSSAFSYQKNILTINSQQEDCQIITSMTTGSLQKSDYHFGWLNYTVLVLYFSSLVWIGWHFSRRQQSTEDYFKGGGRIPWWAAGLSIFGTILSAISFMAIPAKTFATDWSYLMYNLGPLFTAPIVILLFLPFYHRLNITTAYEYLEKRFNLTARLLGSISFMFFQLGRIAIVLYLPAIALNVVTGIDILVCIALMGIISIIYTMMGGIEGVIWTDVLQVIVLMGGAFLSLIWICWEYEGGISDLWQTAITQQKFNILNWAFDWKQPVFWVVFLGGLFSNLVFYGTDQTVVQRYLTASDLRGSTRSVWTNALLVIPGTLLFFTLGTVLFVFYQASPEALQPGLESTDAIFPWYIVSRMPQGFSGLLIAGVFAASMSSLSSSMNSVATSYTTDFHQRFAWKGADLKVARWATLIVGVTGTAFAMFMATSDIKSLWDEFIKIVGLFTGGLGGLFVLGILSKRATGKGALVGLVVSGFVQYWVAIYQPIHLLLFTATGFISCFVIGWLASFILGERKKDLEELTIDL